MYVFMGHMKFEHTQPYENWFWQKNRIELKKPLLKVLIPITNPSNFREMKLSTTTNSLLLPEVNPINLAGPDKI